MERTVIPISAIEHFVYCPRQCALIHCDGVWADNAHTVRGSLAHRRVDSGKARREQGKLVLRAIPLWSEEFGLSGRPMRSSWMAMSFARWSTSQACVMARQRTCRSVPKACVLKRLLGVGIPEAAVWYGGPRRRVRVDLTSGLKNPGARSDRQHPCPA